MKNEQLIREILINNTIHVIAEGGFEKATTKAIAFSGAPSPDIKMNEVYIYRLFGSKEHLYETVFECLDLELLDVLKKALQAADHIEVNAKEKLYRIFSELWHFVLANEEQNECYVRYYYSIYFKGFSLIKHNLRFDCIHKAFAPLFKAEADVKSIMHSVLTTLLSFAVRVYNGDLKDTEENANHIFTVLYCIMMVYFKDELKTEDNMSWVIN
jgi:AcrR family transcriptional regulator